ncbi:MAG: ATPase, T2SS/T4P/T4SS family [Kineosporiaceae bacterium]
MSTPGIDGAAPARRRGFRAQRRQRLGDMLVTAGVLTPEQLDDALSRQNGGAGPRRRLGRVVLEMGLTDELTIATTVADQLGLDMVDLAGMPLSPETVRRLPQGICERHSVCLLEMLPDGRAVVAMADPTNVLALDDVRFTLRADLLTVVALESQIQEQLRQAWSLASGVSDLAQFGEDETPQELPADLAARAVDDSPTVKLVDQILRDAVAAGASDIHLEVQQDSLRVRFRVDGILRDVLAAPQRLAGSVTSRIKIISGLDISERRVPQDGRTRITVGGHEIDTRVSTLPSLHGEKVVIRILTRGDAVPSLEDLGFEPDQLATFHRALQLPQGLILITGPTGSGKTNSLYAGINAVLDPEKNIVTLEDPVEVQLPGITQVQVNTKTGMTFQAGLRSVLRQDPDIVLVGEVRDSETTELALKAAMTGHLVLTTLHTNSAPAALTRLIDMGADPFLVASSLAVSVAQRLVRRPCPRCAAPDDPPDDVLALLGITATDLRDANPVKGTGCSECGGSGYRGRTAVYEVLEVDAAMRRVLVKDPSEAAIVAQAQEAGMRNLRASALLKALDGRTTLEEVLRVTTADRGTPGRRCPACSRPVEASMTACPWCATHLETAACRGCGKRLDEAWRICPWCRHPATGTGTGPRPASGPGDAAGPPAGPPVPRAPAAADLR